MDLEQEVAFLEAHGHLMSKAEKLRNRAQYWPWPLSLFFLFRADALEQKFEELNNKGNLS